MTAYLASDRTSTLADGAMLAPSTRLATRLDRLSGAIEEIGSTGAGLLVEQALGLVAEAEQLLAEQRARIADLERLSVTDEMTGLFNRRGTLDHLRREIALARRHGEPGVVVLCDIDGLKAVNDTLGHAAGDALIQAFAAILRDAVRQSDIVGRLGGDEFALLLARCRADGARGRIDALRERIAAERPVLPVRGRSGAAGSRIWDAAGQTNGTRIALAASFGSAVFTGALDEDAVLARADRALYADKRRRRAPPRCDGS
ncbi:MAG: GGDEF domain-containing protein [Azospirillaceae bacterium]